MSKESARRDHQSSSQSHPIPDPISAEDPNHEDEPPAYCAADSSSANVPGHVAPGNSSQFYTRRIVPPSPTGIDYDAYLPIDSYLSRDQTTITTDAAGSSWSDPSNIFRYITRQVSVPPRLFLEITGTHKGYSQSWSGVETDFALKIDLMGCVCSPSDRPGMNYVQLEQDGKQGKEGQEPLRILAAQFACDDAEGLVKRLIIQRKMINWDQAYIEDRVRILLAELNYRGHVEIKLRSTHATTILRASPASARSAGVFTQVRRIFSRPRDSIIHSIWPYANVAPIDSEAADNSDQRANRSFATCSEQVWWNSWKAAVRNAVMINHQGWVSHDAWVDVVLGCSKAGPTRKPDPWGMDKR